MEASSTGVGSQGSKFEVAKAAGDLVTLLLSRARSHLL